MTEIAPCPHCNHKNTAMLKQGLLPNSMVMKCGNCGYTIYLESKSHDPMRIIEEWNRRESE